MAGTWHVPPTCKHLGGGIAEAQKRRMHDSLVPPVVVPRRVRVGIIRRSCEAQVHATKACHVDPDRECAGGMYGVQADGLTVVLLCGVVDSSRGKRASGGVYRQWRHHIEQCRPGRPLRGANNGWRRFWQLQEPLQQARHSRNRRSVRLDALAPRLRVKWVRTPVRFEGLGKRRTQATRLDRRWSDWYRYKAPPPFNPT
jgi:hypothetical protein